MIRCPEELIRNVLIGFGSKFDRFSSDVLRKLLDFLWSPMVLELMSGTSIGNLRNPMKVATRKPSGYKHILTNRIQSHPVGNGFRSLSAENCRILKSFDRKTSSKINQRKQTKNVHRIRTKSNSSH